MRGLVEAVPSLLEVVSALRDHDRACTCRGCFILVREVVRVLLEAMRGLVEAVPFFRVVVRVL